MPDLEGAHARGDVRVALAREPDHLGLGVEVVYLGVLAAAPPARVGQARHDEALERPEDGWLRGGRGDVHALLDLAVVCVLAGWEPGGQVGWVQGVVEVVEEVGV